MKIPSHFPITLSVLLILTISGCADADKDDLIETTSERLSEVEQRRNSTTLRTVTIDEIPLVGTRIKTALGTEVFFKGQK